MEISIYLSGMVKTPAIGGNMKKIPVIISALLLLVAVNSCKNPCKGVQIYLQIDSRLLNYVFKPGSYWVYQDTVDGIIDSQFVNQYQYSTHVLDHNFPAKSDPCQAPRYLDILQMSFVSVQNNVLKDTLGIGASFSFNSNAINTISIYEHFKQPNETGITCFELDYSQVGLIDRGSGFGSNTYTWSYEGKQNVVTSGGGNYTNVNIFRIQITDPNSTRFTNPTDLYFCSGFGIVKIVEHRPTGDVPWNLIRYNIIN